jgi:hypothetical protein
LLLSLTATSVLGVQERAAADASPLVGAPLIGDWVLNRQRTHYGATAERRRWERFTCHAQGAGVECRIDAQREDGRRTAARFTVPRENEAAPVVGIAEVDAVRLKTISTTIADATFYLRRAPVFGYRAYRGADGRTLTIVAVDPVTRAALTSVVVYDRR